MKSESELQWIEADANNPALLKQDGLIRRHLLSLIAEVRALTPKQAYPTMPEGLNPLTKDLVFRFACALADKLYAAELKYGYGDGWMKDDWMDECRAKLREHITKGDPREVAAYCAFLWHHKERTAASKPTQESGEELTQERIDEIAYVTWRKLCNQNWRNVSGEIASAITQALREAAPTAEPKGGG